MLQSTTCKTQYQLAAWQNTKPTSLLAEPRPKIEADIAIEKQKKKEALERDRQIELEKKTAQEREYTKRQKEEARSKEEAETNRAEEATFKITLFNSYMFAFSDSRISVSYFLIFAC